jgi:NitT/TauT family transport system ATP-binding protein
VGEMALSLSLCHLGKSYSDGSHKEPLRVFEFIDVELFESEFISIIGPSGCGKTTLLRVIAGLDRPSEGEVRLDGVPICGIDKRIGLVFQEYALFPWRTTLQNIEMGLEIQGIPRKQRRKSVHHYIDAFGLSGFENEYPYKLSGGMKQRVAIARTLITNPEVVLMDEPFGSLDSQTRNKLQEFLLTVWLKQRETILFVTHNVDEAVFLSDRIIILSKRPSRIVDIIEVNELRPRDRTGQKANRIRRHILKLLS